MKRLVPLLLCCLVSLLPAEAANIYFVSFHSADNSPSAGAATAGFTQAPDIGYTQLLQANGHTVTRVVTSGTPDVNTLNGADLVIISRSVPSGDYELDAETAAWNGITAPTIILGGYVLRNSRLGFTTGTTIPDTAGTVRLTALVPGHPIFAGVALGAGNTMVNPYANIVTYTNNPQRGISVNNNPIAPGGVILATIGTPGDPANGGMVIGEWAAGTATANSPPDTLGGHRLVLLTGSREANGLTSEGSGIYDLTGDGAQLLLNAVKYMTASRIVTVNTVNNDTPGATETSLLEAVTGAQEGDFIRFNIPGPGPHVIVTPIGGYPLITANNVTIDGYTQLGSAPNTNSILGGNNAQMDIVLDSTGADTAPNPVNPALPLRRSTRLDFPNDPGSTGYGTSENCMLGIYQADNVTVRGLSFIARRTPGSDDDPTIYAVALIREATNARVQGSWFGIAPGAGTTLADVKPPASAVAAFRWRIGGDIYSAGAIIGTDGDGVSDRAEFNVMVGGRISLALELPGPKISGNYVNLFPNGLSFLNIDESYQAWVDVFTTGGSDPGDVTVENWENGRVADNTTIGTDGDGVSDAEERNIFGHTAYDVHGEFYSPSATNVVIAGNYFGVAGDGITRAPVSTNISPDFISLPGSASVRIGSNGDNVSDELEANVLVKIEGSSYVRSGAAVPIVARGNKMEDNGFDGVIFADGQNGRVYTTYYAPAILDVNLGVVPVLTRLTNGIVYGNFAAPSTVFSNTVVDIYTVDPAAVANTNGVWPAARIHPLRWLASFVDNTVVDLDGAPNQFAYNLNPFALPAGAYVTVAVTYSKNAAATVPGEALTSPMSNPVTERPVLNFLRTAPDQLTFWWLGGPNQYFLQVNPSFDPNNWLDIDSTTPGWLYQGGRTSVPQPIFFNDLNQFFRLKSQ